eukprot:jgi/Galph1/2017/GphlegSOOS_G670.1
MNASQLTFQDFYQLQDGWKHLKLTDEQQQLVSTIEQRLTHPIKSLSTSHEDPEKAKDIKQVDYSQDKSAVQRLEEELWDIETFNDFYSWMAQAQELFSAKELEEYEEKEKYLQQSQEKCEQITKILDYLKKMIDELGRASNISCEHVETFLQKVNSCLKQHSYSQELVRVLSSRLTSIDLTEQVSRLLTQNELTPLQSNFWNKLNQVEQTIQQFISSKSFVSQADELLVNLIDVELQFFTSIEHAFHQEIIHQCSDFLKSTTTYSNQTISCTTSSELHSNAPLYTHFRAVAWKLKNWMTMLEKRANVGIDSVRVKEGSESLGFLVNSRLKRGAQQCLNNCQKYFLKERQRLLEPILFRSFDEFRRISDIVQMARNSGSLLVRLLFLEQSLFEDLFVLKENETAESYLRSTLDQFGSQFYYTWKPRFVEQQKLSKLVEVVEVFHSEIAVYDESESDTCRIATSCLKKTLRHAVADVQERITYLSQVYVRQEIQSYQLEQEDIDSCCFLKAEKVATQQESNVQNDSSVGTVLPFVHWYRPVERTLRLLSLLYRRLTPEVFSGLAQEAVSSCVYILMQSSQQLKRMLPSDCMKDHPMLFLISQLCVLREQIQPFDTDFSYQGKLLNLSELRNAMIRMIWKSHSLEEFQPIDSHRQVIYDSKHSLESELTKACTHYVMFLCHSFLEPLLQLLSQVNHAMGESSLAIQVDVNDSKRLASVSSSEEHTTDEVRTCSISLPLWRETWDQVWSLLKENLSLKIYLLKHYIRKPSFREQLLSSVCSNTSTSCMEMLTILQTHYTLEEREEIGISGQKVHELIEKVKAICNLSPSVTQESS